MVWLWHRSLAAGHSGETPAAGMRAVVPLASLPRRVSVASLFRTRQPLGCRCPRKESPHDLPLLP